MKQGINFIFHHAGLLFVILAFASAMFVLGCFGPLIAVYVRDSLHASANVFGIASALIGAGMLIGINALDRAEVRRLTQWFDGKLNREVTEPLVGEKMMKRFLALGEPNSGAIRAGKANLGYHLDYITFLVERRRWLAGDHFSLADISAAAHLSALDYLGDVPWEAHEPAKEWYARIKSRPSFRPLLADHIPGAPPPKHYADLDF